MAMGQIEGENLKQWNRSQDFLVVNLVNDNFGQFEANAKAVCWDLQSTFGPVRQEKWQKLKEPDVKSADKRLGVSKTWGRPLAIFVSNSGCNCTAGL